MRPKGKSTISLFLDTRRQKKSNKYPVKLRIYDPLSRKQKFYSTVFEFTKSEYSLVRESAKTPKDLKEEKIKLSSLEVRANEALQSLTLFSFEKFEEAFYGADQSSTNKDVDCYYNRLIAQYRENKQITTASSYECSYNSLRKFNLKKPLSFYDINQQWLQQYQNYMVESLGNSRTTVGIYLRTLRAIFNLAIEEHVIQKDIYPFAKRKFSIPQGRGVKKALNQDDLKKLWKSTPTSIEQKKAKDFWFFSYGCFGMNMKDIALLEYSSIKEDTIVCKPRAKTINTAREPSPITVFLNSFTKGVISEYGNPDRSAKNRIFPIIKEGSDPQEEVRQIQNFNRFVSNYIQQLAKDIGINPKISFGWARHTFATTSIRKGASMELVGEAMSHTNIKTTHRYFAGFEDNQKRDIANKLFKF